MRAVFLIKSPLQFLNALEAKCHFELDAEECLLVLMADRKSRGQLAKLVDRERERWGEIVWLCTSPLRMKPFGNGVGRDQKSCFFSNELFSIFKLRHLAGQCQDLELTIVGDAGNPLMRDFAFRAAARDTVLLDDGVASLKYARWRSQGIWDENLRRSKRINRFLKRCLLGLRDDLPGRVTFFSVYALEVVGEDRCVPNHFSFMRKAVADLDLSGEVFFLGGPLVEANILTEEEYFWHLERVGQFFNGQLRYVAHRRESPERVTRIGEAFGWPTVLFDYPIEYQLARVGPRPPKIASFISSALENCQQVFGDKIPVVSFRFNPEVFSLAETPKGQEVQAVYRRYQNMSTATFEIVDL